MEWRTKTELPVVKVLFYQLLPRRPAARTLSLQLAIEHFPCSLALLPRLPLFQLLYLLKEALVGFERLYDRFGGFDISDRMVLLSKSGRCRVWFNEDLSANHPASTIAKTQLDLKLQILRMFQNKCIRSSLSLEFFAAAHNGSRLVETIQLVDAFAKANRIVLPSKLTLSPDHPRTPTKHEQNLEMFRDLGFGHESLKKIPRFIAQLREERLERKEDKESKSFDSPTTRRTHGVNRDLSQTKLVAPTYPKCEVESTSKSIISPKSYASFEMKAENRSSNEVKLSRPARRLIKQISHENFNSFSTLTPHSRTFFLSPDKQTHSHEEMPEELFFSKHPATPTQKYRKLSNADDKNQPFTRESSAIQEPKKEEKSVQSSQQTAATVNECRRGRRKAENPNDLLPKIQMLKSLEKDGKDVFEKNGWLKRMSTLMVDNFRDTLHSHFDGHEAFS